MPIAPQHIEPQEHIRIRGLSGTNAGNDRDLVILGGVALFGFPGGADWNRNELVFKPLPAYSWQIVNYAVVFVSPNSFSQDGAMNNAGWAVDNFRKELDNNQIQLRVGIACRGNRANLARAAYHVTALGRLADF
jgi:hypothetical protein